MTSKIVDTLLLGLVAGVGIVGSICVFSDDLGTPTHDLSLISNHPIVQSSLSGTSDESHVLDYLDVQPSKTDHSVLFEISEYHPKARYQFKSGDGHEQLVSDRQFNYTYKDTGDYQVQLLMSYGGQKKLVACKNIAIF